MKNILLGLVLGLLFSSCANQNALDVSNGKSCFVLLEEKDFLQKELSNLQSVKDTKDTLGITIVGTGAILSGLYLFVDLTYFYVLPSVSVFYNNWFVKRNELLEKKQALQKSMAKISQLIKDKSCQNQTL